MAQVATLEAAVDSAVQQVRLYKYKPPPAVSERLQSDYISNYLRRAGRHHQLLEVRLWNALPSSVWTDDPEEADFFVVPHSLSGQLFSPRTGGWKGIDRYMDTALGPFLEHIFFALPFFNRSAGRDHLFAYAVDNGPELDCHGRNGTFAEAYLHHPVAIPMIRAMLKVGYYGNRDPKWGWRPNVDVAVPMFNEHHLRHDPEPWQLFAQNATHRDIFYRGQVVKGEVSCPGSALPPFGCSIGARPLIMAHMREPEWVNRSSQRSMGSATYALCPAGFACWSTRLYDAIDRLSIPAIFAAGAIQPFETFLDWPTFSVSINNDEATDALSRLHTLAAAMASTCAAPSCQPMCAACRELEPVQMLQRLSTVRRWFQYDPSTSRSAWGLFLLELMCRSSRARLHEQDICAPIKKEWESARRSRRSGNVPKQGRCNWKT